MTIAQINEIVAPILQHRFQANVFKGSGVSSEEDFDGEVVLRVTARITRPADVMDRVDATLEIKGVLEQKGENRVVYLDVATNDEQDASEHSDEDA